MHLVWVAALCAVLCGCATKYQEIGLTGGVEAQQIAADTYRIVRHGNASTGSNTIKDYALLKAAETARATGATHFAVVSAENANRTETIVTPGTASTTHVGNQDLRLLGEFV